MTDFTVPTAHDPRPDGRRPEHDPPESTTPGEALLAAVFPGDSAMARHCRALDWAATPLGPVARWPQSLRTAVGLCLAAPGPMCLSWGPALTLVYNDGYQAVLGAVKHPGALGRPTRAVWAEIWDQVAPELARVMAGGPPAAHEDQRLVLRRGDRDDETFFSYAFVPVREEAGRVGGGLHVFTETTARVRAEAALRAERERLRLLILHTPAAMALLEGPEHRYTLVNDAYRRVSGPRPDVVGRPLRETFPELAGQGLYERFDQVYATGEPWVAPETLVRYDRDGTGVQDAWFDLRVAPVRDGGGRVVGLLHFSVDVTAQVHARRQVERLLGESERARAEADDARRAAEAADAAKTQFLNSMSHELRTPLNAIGGYTQLLDMGVAGPVSDAQRAYLARVAASGRHLLGLVNDVLDLGKLDAGQLGVARDTYDVSAAVEGALALVLPQAEAQGVTLVDGCRPSLPAHGTERAEPAAYVGDEHRVRQILVNLLANAVKFTPAGGTVTVACAVTAAAPPEARVAGQGPWARLAVRDTGAGIAPERQAAVFEPFVQVETGPTRAHGGTGLGLTISRRLARLMGGDLTLDSAPGAGTTATLWLPAPGGVPHGMDGADETAGARADRAHQAVAGYRVHGLEEVGRHLASRLDALMEAHVARLRSDPATAAEAHGRPRVDLEDHLLAFGADLAQALVTLEGGAATEAALLEDGMDVRRLLAERHGRQRAGLGWSAEPVAREYAILGEELHALVRRHVPAGAGDVDAALAVLDRLVARAAADAARGHRQAGAAAVADPVGAPSDGLTHNASA